MRDDGNHIALSVINSIMSSTMPETNFLKYTGAILQADTCKIGRASCRERV